MVVHRESVVITMFPFSPLNQVLWKMRNGCVMLFNRGMDSHFTLNSLETHTGLVRRCAMDKHSGMDVVIDKEFLGYIT
jgi:hypothetical protein